MAGFRELLAVEWDANAVETFKMNFPEVPVYHGDIAQLEVSAILQKTGLAEGELDVFDGSPPCQGFSTAGKRKVEDNRNQLFKEFVRLLRGLKPKMFVMDNVSGMVKGKMKLVFAEVLKELRESGYLVHVRLMNTKYFGVPQSRQRIIFIGARNDRSMPDHPTPMSWPLSLRSALENVPEGLSDGEFTGKKLELVKQIKSWRDGSDVVKGQSFNLKRLCWKKPSRTILKSVGKPNSSYGGGLVHPVLHRHLTIAELKRVNSFPDEMQMIGSFQDQWARIGNSVPPLFMRTIALHLRKLLDQEKGSHDGHSD
jgi:DNA (cytosine-5)-methyltransferase 1